MFTHFQSIISYDVIDTYNRHNKYKLIIMSETLPKNVEESRLQSAMNETVDWKKENGMFINPTKTYEMVIAGRPDIKDIPQIEINQCPIERVTVTKLAGVHIQSDLKWDTHVDFIISKASPKLYFLTALKKSKLTPKDLLKFYLSVIRSQLGIRSTGICKIIAKNPRRKKIDSVQKRAMYTVYHISRSIIQRSSQNCRYTATQTKAMFKLFQRDAKTGQYYITPFA